MLPPPGAATLRRLGRELRRRDRSLLVGALVGYAVAAATGVALALNAAPGAFPDPLVIFGCLAGTWLGRSAGALVAAIRPLAASPGPRAAHARARTADVYIAPAGLWGIRVAVALGVAAAVASLLAPPISGAFLPRAVPGVLAGAALAGLLLGELGVRVGVLRRPSIATDERDLLWDDALRAADVRAATEMTPALAVLAIGTGLLSAGGGFVVQPEVVQLGLGGFLLLVIGAVFASITFRNRNRFLERLWPDATGPSEPGAAAADTVVA